MKEDVLVAFGRKVRAFRDKLGLSQEQLADKCGMDRTYISGIERGLRNVSLKNIVCFLRHWKYNLLNY